MKKEERFELVVFPEMSMLSSKIAEILISSSKAKLVKEREIPFPPAIVINKNEDFEIPKERIYKSKNLIIRIFDATPVYPEEIIKLSKNLAKEIIKETDNLINIVGRQLVGEGPLRIYLISNFEKNLYPPFQKPTQFSGIEGMPGLLYYYLKNTKVKTSVWLVDFYEKDREKALKEVLTECAKRINIKVEFNESINANNKKEPRNYIG
ncbi:MAG: hypothetical protein QXV66_00085 [Candidatus Rehaiarchaeum fermentans]|nr:hypothetical protein [Candidatus Rehaiarchaeum fermentans]